MAVLLSQLAVLAVLASEVGLGGPGWLAGTGFAVVTWAVLHRAGRRPGAPGWGPADTVTLVRATLVGGVVALVAQSLPGPASAPVPPLVALAAMALLLDAVDGQVARRTGTASRFGARFDVEIDSVLVLVLSVFVAGLLGWWWVLAVGGFRYAFMAAAGRLPWLRRELPERRSRKVVAATQGAVLVVTSTGLLPAPLAAGALGVTLALLGWSFGRDIGWLWRLRRRTPAPIVEFRW